MATAGRRPRPAAVPLATPALSDAAIASARGQLQKTRSGNPTTCVLSALSAMLRERYPNSGPRAFCGADGLLAMHEDAIGLGLETCRGASHGSRLVDGPHDRRYTGVVLVYNNNDDGDHGDLAAIVPDWLMVLHVYRGVAKPVVVVVAAGTWRLFWFADGAPSVARDADTEEHFTDGNVVCVCGTRAYHVDDTGLARLLVGVFDDMAAALATVVGTAATERSSLVACVDSAAVSWVSLDTDSDADCADNGADSKHQIIARDRVGKDGDRFLLTTYLGAGLDGRAWVCRSRGDAWHARGCVLKFGHGDRRGRNADCGKVQPASLYREMQLWRSLWGVDEARVLHLAGRPALLMPFAYAVAMTPNRGVLCVDPQTRAEVVHAIERMAAHGLCHDDLAWRHVGRIQRPDGRKQIVLFDLARVRAMSPAEAAVAMRSQLDLD
ncbi:hypothetical protein psal_cds_202 [Pandoravirus salinus]|uniref:DUF5898 domain-containing protein n=1 Tax=Pandoravirus salinus TaxID=1349410 RepID=S4W0S9_9VIRU|nr:hypothetical protein psal_cds_202 [Pandoravirus salinus]AGO83720.1 hypothetical protein psal_cds_202 [Pandoravirus salinus]